MRIAVNTRHWVSKNKNGLSYYCREVFTRMAMLHPEHLFIFIFGNEADIPGNLPENAEAVVVGLKKKNSLALKWWYDVKIPLALKKYKADVFVSPEGICSLNSSNPQVLVVPNLNFLNAPRYEPKSELFLKKKYMPAFLKKAKAVVTVSDNTREQLAEKFGLERNKIINAGIGVNPVFQPLEWQEREVIKGEFSEGFEYFVFVGGNNPAKNLMNLLRAFSGFKKWQKSGMKLLVVGKMDWPGNPLDEKLKTYKHREDVKILGYLDEEKLAKVVAGAYAMVHPVFSAQFGLPVLEAMKAGVPVITTALNTIKEITGDAALFADPDNLEEIAGQMKMIFKDENLRSQLIEAGKIKVAPNNWDNTAELLFKAIEAAVSG